MAQSAVGGIYAYVVKRCRDKVGCVVTGTAVLVGRQVIYTLTQADHIVMASAAQHGVKITGIVAKEAGGECTRRVANIAIFRSRQVNRRLACRTVYASVMAGLTCITHDIRSTVIN